jgi:hypothetical protein
MIDEFTAIEFLTLLPVRTRIPPLNAAGSVGLTPPVNPPAPPMFALPENPSAPLVDCLGGSG